MRVQNLDGWFAVVLVGALAACFLAWPHLRSGLGIHARQAPEEDARPTANFWRVFVVFAFLSVCLWMWWFQYGIKWAASQLGQTAGGIQELGQIGDLFGGVNALFAALAFAGVGAASYYQWKSAEIQRKTSLDQSARSAHDVFSLRFFHLLERAQSVTDALIAPPYADAHGASGRAALTEFAESLRSSLRPSLAEHFDTPQNLKESIRNYYNARYRTVETTFGPLFRVRYHTFKIIDSSELTEDDKVSYANIARAEMSSDEVFILAVNCLTAWGKDLVPFVEKYHLLKHHRQEEGNGPSFDSQMIQTLFSPSTYAARD